MLNSKPMNHVIILAAGKATRMKSELHKVLHPVKGVPIIKRLLKSIEPICQKPTLIVGHKAEDVIRETDNKYNYVVQAELLGTGHAIMCAQESLKDKGYKNIVVLMGDHPLVSTHTIQDILDLQASSGATVTLGTVIVPHFENEYSIFAHFGRIIRGSDGTVDRIVEYKDATEEERASKEVNLNYICFDASWLWNNVMNLSHSNVAQEYYITDLVKMAKDQGKIVAAYPLKNIVESYGINTPEQLKMVEEVLS